VRGRLLHEPRPYRDLGSLVRRGPGRPSARWNPRQRRGETHPPRHPARRREMIVTKVRHGCRSHPPSRPRTDRSTTPVPRSLPHAPRSEIEPRQLDVDRGRSGSREDHARGGSLLGPEDKVTRTHGTHRGRRGGWALASDGDSIALAVPRTRTSVRGRGYPSLHRSADGVRFSHPRERGRSRARSQHRSQGIAGPASGVTSCPPQIPFRHRAQTSRAPRGPARLSLSLVRIAARLAAASVRREGRM
jgi:hypothetical protein